MTSQQTTLVLRIGATIGLPGSLYLAVTGFQAHDYFAGLFNGFVTVMFLTLLVAKVTVRPRDELDRS